MTQSVLCKDLTPSVIASRFSKRRGNLPFSFLNPSDATSDRGFIATNICATPIRCRIESTQRIKQQIIPVLSISAYENP